MRSVFLLIVLIFVTTTYSQRIIDNSIKEGNTMTQFVPRTSIHIVHITNEDGAKAKCFLTYHSKFEMSLEFHLSNFDIYNQTLQDAQGFMFTMIETAIRSNSYHSLNRYKDPNGDESLLLSISSSVDTIQIPKRRLSFSDEQIRVLERIKKLEDMNQFFMHIAKGITGQISTNINYTLSITDNPPGSPTPPRYYPSSGLYVDGKLTPGHQSWDNSRTLLNFTLNSAKNYAISHPIIFEVEPKGILNKAIVHTDIEWMTHGESGKAQVFNNQELMLRFHISMDANEWKLVGEHNITIPEEFSTLTSLSQFKHPNYHLSNVKLNISLTQEPFKYISITAYRNLEHLNKAMLLDVNYNAVWKLGDSTCSSAHHGCAPCGMPKYSFDVSTYERKQEYCLTKRLRCAVSASFKFIA